MAALILFDIDMTLIRTNGAGLRAMNRTLQHLHGIPEGFTGMAFAGRTDGAILRDCYTTHELHHDDLAPTFAAFKERYFVELERELRDVGGVEVLPGVVALLDLLAADTGFTLGLGTGNYRRAAVLKLRHAGLWERFLDGGFADDAEERAEVIATGIRRLSSGRSQPDAPIWIVGDSPHDVTAGKANGAWVLGVGTGHSTPAELLAAGADLAMDDLSDTAAVLQALRQR